MAAMVRRIWTPLREGMVPMTSIPSATRSPLISARQETWLADGKPALQPGPSLAGLRVVRAMADGRTKPRGSAHATLASGRTQMAGHKKEHHVVIVGTGFAGFNAARELSRLVGKTTEIVVINSTDYFLYLPLMPQVTGGLIEPRHIRASLPDGCARCGSSSAR